MNEMTRTDNNGTGPADPDQRANTQQQLDALSATAEQYNSTANQLSDRILSLIPDHPEILTLTDIWDLLEVPGFNCQDLSPSMYQAGWALAKARQRYKEGERV